MSGSKSALVEWVLLGASFCASCFTGYGLREAILDHGFLIASGINGLRKAVAEMNQRGEIFRLMKCFVFMMAAFMAATATEAERRAFILAMALILSSVIMAFHSFLDRQTRLKMAKISAESHPTDPVTGRKIAHKGETADGGRATFEPLEKDDRRTR